MPKKIKSILEKGGQERKHIRYKNGVYEVRMRIDGVDYAASSKDRTEAIRKFIHAIRKGSGENITIGSKNVPSTFQEFAMFYFENYRIKKVTEITYRNDYYRFRKHLQPFFLSMPLKKITAQHCQMLFDENTYSGKTQKELYSILNQIFKLAIAYGLMTQNPLSVVLISPHEGKHGVALTKEEEQLLLTRTAGTPYQLMFAVALYTGMRPNEYSTARIEGQFIVSKNSKRKGGRIAYKRIPIIPLLKPYLAGITELKFYHLDNIRDKYATILPKHRLYDLRTTFYTRCCECGIAEAARDEFVGHEGSKLKRAYTDLSDEFLLKEGNRLKW